jgi:hypothetical protein
MVNTPLAPAAQRDLDAGKRLGEPDRMHDGQHHAVDPEYFTDAVHVRLCS